LVEFFLFAESFSAGVIVFGVGCSGGA